MFPGRAIVVCIGILLIIVVDGFTFVPKRCIESNRRLCAASASLPSQPESDDIDTDDDNFEVLRELFLEAVSHDEAGIGLKSKSAASLNDLTDLEFKMYMLKRLGKEDYDRIFNHPRVDFDLR